MSITVGPIPGDLICAQYNLTSDEFAALAPNIRALYRMAYAVDVMKVREDGPPHENHGPEVDRVLGICGFPGGGEPWCIAQIAAYLIDSGVSKSQMWEGLASVHSCLAWAESNNLVIDEPVRGCLALFIFSPTEGHGVQVSHPDGDTVWVIAGNSNSDGSRDGWEDVRKQYQNSAVHAFVDISHLTS